MKPISRNESYAADNLNANRYCKGFSSKVNLFMKKRINRLRRQNAKKIIQEIILSFIVLSSITGCAGLKKTETSGITTSMSVNSVSWLWKIMPGYRQRTLRRHDFQIEVQEKKLRLDELRYDRRDARLKYGKLQ